VKEALWLGKKLLNHRGLGLVSKEGEGGKNKKNTHIYMQSGDQKVYSVRGDAGNKKWEGELNRELGGENFSGKEKLTRGWEELARRARRIKKPLQALIIKTFAEEGGWLKKSKLRISHWG